MIDRETIDRIFKANEKVKKNMAMYVMNLMVFGTIAVSRRKEWFLNHKNPKWHKYDVAMHAQKILIESGLAKLIKGKNSIIPNQKGFSSRLTGTPGCVIGAIRGAPGRCEPALRSEAPTSGPGPATTVDIALLPLDSSWRGRMIEQPQRRAIRRNRPEEDGLPAHLDQFNQV
jgi:hypothetical protein